MALEFLLTTEQFLAPEAEQQGRYVGTLAECFAQLVADGLQHPDRSLLAGEGAEEVALHSWLVAGPDVLAQGNAVLEERELTNDRLTVGERIAQFEQRKGLMSQGARERAQLELANARHAVARRMYQAIFENPFAYLSNGVVAFANSLGDHARWPDALRDALTAEARRLGPTVIRTGDADTKRLIVARMLLAETFRDRGLEPPVRPAPRLTDVSSAAEAALRIEEYLKERVQVDAAAFTTLDTVYANNDALVERYLTAVFEHFFRPWCEALREVVITGRPGDKKARPTSLKSWVNEKAAAALVAKLDAQQVFLFPAEPGQIAECWDYATIANDDVRYRKTAPIAIAVTVHVPRGAGAQLFVGSAQLCWQLLHTLAHMLVVLDKTSERPHDMQSFYRTLHLCYNVSVYAGLATPLNAFGLPPATAVLPWYANHEDENMRAAVTLNRLGATGVADMALTTAAVEKWSNAIVRGEKMAFTTRGLLERGQKRTNAAMREASEGEKDDEEEDTVELVF